MYKVINRKLKSSFIDFINPRLVHIKDPFLISSMIFILNISFIIGMTAYYYYNTCKITNAYMDPISYSNYQFPSNMYFCESYEWVLLDQYKADCDCVYCSLGDCNNCNCFDLNTQDICNDDCKDQCHEISNNYGPDVCALLPIYNWDACHMPNTSCSDYNTRNTCQKQNGSVCNETFECGVDKSYDTVIVSTIYTTCKTFLEAISLAVSIVAYFEILVTVIILYIYLAISQRKIFPDIDLIKNISKPRESSNL